MRAALRLRHVEGVTRKGKFGGATLRVPRYTLRARGFSTQESGTFFAMKKCLTLLLVVGFVLCGLQMASAFADTNKTAKQQKDADEKIEQKAVVGELVHMGKRAMSVEFAQSEAGTSEILLPINDRTKVERVRTLGDLKPGDRIEVQYEQTYKDGEGGIQIILRTMATRVTLLRSAAKQGNLRSAN